MAVTGFEPFSAFLEERIDLRIFEDLPPVDPRPKYKSLDTQTLIQEFDYIYGEVELNNGSFLTPPQSPPLSPTYNIQPTTHTYLESASKETCFALQHQDLVFLNTLSDNTNKSGYMVTNVDDMILLDVPVKNFTGLIPATSQSDDMILLDAPVKNFTGLISTTSQPDVATELAVVDELLRTRAEDMDVSSDPWITSNSYSPSESSESDFVPSPSTYAQCPSESGSENSHLGDVSTDPEWIPMTVNTPVKASAPKRKRAKPYGRPVEDKKLRKKEQNKNAATRYRQKKKQEVEVILDEEKILEDKNDDLKEKVKDMQREIRYLKGLMRDLFKAKGVLK